MGLNLSELKYIQKIDTYNHETTTVVLISEITPVISHLIEGLLYRLENVQEGTVIALLDENDVTQQDIDLGYFVQSDLGRRRSTSIVKRYSGLFKTEIYDYSTSLLAISPTIFLKPTSPSTLIPIYASEGTTEKQHKKDVQQMATITNSLNKVRNHHLRKNKQIMESKGLSYGLLDLPTEAHSNKFESLVINCKYNNQDYKIIGNYCNGYSYTRDGETQELVPKLDFSKKKVAKTKRELFTHYALISQSILNMFNAYLTNDIGLDYDELEYSGQGLDDKFYIKGYNADNIFRHFYANKMDIEYTNQEGNDLGDDIFNYFMANWEQLNEDYKEDIEVSIDEENGQTIVDKKGKLSTERIKKYAEMIMQALNYINMPKVHKKAVDTSSLECGKELLSEIEKDTKRYEVINYVLEKVLDKDVYILNKEMTYKSIDYPITLHFVIYGILEYIENEIIKK